MTLDVQEFAACLLLAPLVCTAANVALHVIISHALRLSHLLSLIAAFAAGLAGLLLAAGLLFAASPLAGAETAALLALSVLSYGALGYCYFTLVNLTATSLRIRALRHILNAPGQGVSPEALRAIYGAGDLLDVRLERLVHWRQITRRDGRVFVSGHPGFLILARAVDFLRRFLLPGRSS
jgi:hypothetical protein